LKYLRLTIHRFYAEVFPPVFKERIMK